MDSNPIESRLTSLNALNILLTDDSSSSSEDEEVMEILFKKATKIPRISIVNFFEEVVPAYSDKEFIRHFRIKRTLFHSLSIEYENTDCYQKMLKQNPNRVMRPDKTLAIFLWFAANERYTYRNLSDRFNVSISTVYEIILRGTAFISNLSHKVIRWSTNDEMREEAEERERESRIPGIVGCIDGTHILIDPPKNNKDDYIDRKGDVTLTVQAVCNKEKKFIDRFIGYPGSVHDSRVFRNSPLDEQLKNLPLGYRLLGDSAYPCLVQLLTPYRDNGHLTAAQRNFNTILSSQRIDIEHTFGILKQRFRSLYFCRLRGMKLLCHFIRACMVLHNLSKLDDLDFTYEETDDSDDDDLDFIRADGPQNGVLLRNEICHYLSAA